eukprot:3278738-Rhodomonas_salina.1
MRPVSTSHIRTCGNACLHESHWCVACEGEHESGESHRPVSRPAEKNVLVLSSHVKPVDLADCASEEIGAKSKRKGLFLARAVAKKTEAKEESESAPSARGLSECVLAPLMKYPCPILLFQGARSPNPSR